MVGTDGRGDRGVEDAMTGQRMLLEMLLAVLLGVLLAALLAGQGVRQATTTPEPVP
jgi:uncharacterized membrane protein affecting hemolysin expression